MAFGHRHFVEIYKFLCSLCVCVCVCICGCPRIDDEVEELQHWCGNATGLRKKAAQGKEEMSQGTSERWNLKREKVSGHWGSLWYGVACCIYIKWWATALSATLIRKWPEQCKSQLSRFLPPSSSYVKSDKCHERRDVRWEWMVKIWWR